MCHVVVYIYPVRCRDGSCCVMGGLYVVAVVFRIGTMEFEVC